MKIVLMDWNSIGNQDMQETLRELGHTVIACPFHSKIGRENSEWEETFSQTLRTIQPDFVFSFNYFPIIATVCNRENTLYYSWVYDSPLHALYSKTVFYPCNRIFLFDKELYFQMKDLKIDTVFYLPLAVNTRRLAKMKLNSSGKKDYQCDISFVGSMYTEPKHQLFERLDTLSDYAKGYLSALIETQKNIYGSTIMREALSPEILQMMMEAYPVTPHNDGMETAIDIYTDYFLLREVTARERKEMLAALGQMYGSSYDIHLHTHDTTLDLPGIKVFSEVDYYNQMPYVFHKSRINLNITLRSIISGIPLRALDIMGCGGFLLTNYQADFLDCFTPDEDFVYYDSKQDMLEKTDYYLKHDTERKKIAENGYIKICENYDYPLVLEQMLKI